MPGTPGLRHGNRAYAGCVYFDGVGMTDRELLELAAMAAGVELQDDHYWSDGFWTRWNPLTDDGDALRLAVKLEMCIDFMDCRVIAGNLPEVVIDFDDDYRRAIVRAAAEIGRSMK